MGAKMNRLAGKVVLVVLAAGVGLIGAGVAMYELASAPTSHSTPAPAYSVAPSRAAAQTTAAP